MKLHLVETLTLMILRRALSVRSGLVIRAFPTCIVLTALVVAVIGAPAFAAQRTFVASAGSDANPCSLGSPCRSFAAAIGQTDAGGEIVVLDSAGYGNVTITKSIAIIAPSGVHAGISVFAGNGVTVNAPNSKVMLSGLTISGQGGAKGIVFDAGEELTVERCDVSGMQYHGIVAQATSARLRVHDTRVSGNGLEGIAVYGTVSADIGGVRSHANALSGLSAVNGARVTVTRSEFSQNATHGVEVYNVFGPPTTYLAIDSSTISGNAIFGVKAYSPVFGRIEMALTRSTVAGNAADGIVALALGNPVVVAVSDTTVMSNGGNGLWADGYLASIIASRNSVSRQAGYGIYVTGNAAVYSTGDNVVEANIGGASSGVISAATVR